ncbi:choice-of-anchor K domain-containing protein, partial [Marinobacterium stanieri]|uniref:choice-of-anchor K domain-containing protein n=1 Tax=Marinobacterium stanieri TaxID=49186 RepID=UPI003A8DB47E
TTFTAESTPDDTYEGAETVVATISNATTNGGDDDLVITTDEATGTILDDDSIPTIGDGSVVVSEEGLNIPAEDKVGLEDADAGSGYTDQTNDASDSGSLTITGNGTAALTVAIDLSSLPTGLESGGESISWAYEPGNEAVAIGSTAAGTEVIRVELNGGDESVNTAGSTPPGSIGYSVSLSQPVDHGVNSLEDTLSFDFDVSISDGSNTSVDTGTVSVTIEDDMPAEKNDSNTLEVQINDVEIGELQTSWSNPQGGDSGAQDIENGAPGQDDVISWDPSNYTFDDNNSLINNQNVAVNSTFEIGEFTHNNYPTDTGNAISSVDLDLSFNVVINGYVATVNHTISFEHDETPNSGSDPRDIVTISNASTIVPVTITTPEGEETYNFEIIGFVDGSGNVVDTVYTDENASNSFQLMGQLVSSDAPEVTGQVDFGFGADGPADANSVEWDGIANGMIQGNYGVLTVDDEGNYSYQLDQDAYDSLSPGDEPIDSFTYTVMDADGDSVESTLAININAIAAPQAPDLLPEGEDETVDLEVGATTTNLLLTLDVSGSMDENVSGTGKTRFEIAQESLVSTIQAYQSMGETEVNLTLFASSAYSPGWMNAADAIEYINGLDVNYWNGAYYNGSPLNIGSSTDYRDALDATETVSFSGHTADQTIAYFLSDGNPTQNQDDVDSDYDSTIQDWKEFIEGNDADLQGNVDKLFVVGIGNNVSGTYLDIVQVQEGESPIIVSDETQLVDTLTNTATASVSGDVSDNVTGGDGDISIDSITLYGVIYTADGSNGTVQFPSEGVELDGQGTLSFDFNTGQYTYSVQPGEFSEGLTTKQFSVTVSDQDGDEASFDVNIEVSAVDPVASTPELDGDIQLETGAGLHDEDSTYLSGGPLGGVESMTYGPASGAVNSFSVEVSAFNGQDQGKIELFKAGQLIQSFSVSNGINSGTNLPDFDTLKVSWISGNNDRGFFVEQVDLTPAVLEYDLDMSAALTDLDNSETLSDITVDGLPTGTSITGTGVTANADGTYTVALNASGEAENDVKLLSNRQLTDAELESITISVTSTESSTGHQNTVTATLVDGIVAGVAYLTSSGLSGMTDENGSFEYREGDSVTFLVGNVVVGTASASDLAEGQVFLQDLANVDRSDLNNEYVENMAVFLQSLDSDGNAANGISISAATHAALSGANLNLQAASEAELKALIEGLGESYVSEEEAMAHVREMLEQYAGITEFEDHVDDSIQTGTLATEPVTGLTYQTSSGIEGELNAGVFEYDAGDVVSIYAGDQLVAEFDSSLIGSDDVITFDEAGFSLTWDELQELLAGGSADELDETGSAADAETDGENSEVLKEGDEPEASGSEDESSDTEGEEPVADEAEGSDEGNVEQESEEPVAAGDELEEEPVAEEIEPSAPENESDSEEQNDDEVSLLDDGGDIFGVVAEDEPPSDDEETESEGAGEDEVETSTESESGQQEGEVLQAADLFEEEQGDNLDNLLGSDEPSEDEGESGGEEQPQNPQQENVDGLVDNAALMDNLVSTPDTSSDL